MSDEQSWEFLIHTLRNRIAHMDERERATVEYEIVHLTRKLAERSTTEFQQFSGRLKCYQEALRVTPTTPERQYSRKRSAVRLYINEAGKLIAGASRLPRSEPAVPPPGACFLLDLLLSQADRKVVPGDLEEEFRVRLPQYRPMRARLWFWGETVRTIATRNVICRSVLVGGLVRLGEWIFRQIGS